MRPSLWLLASALLLIALTGVFSGSAPFARLAFMLGMPRVGAALTSDLAVKGVGLYLGGDYPSADDAFRLAGRTTTYNRGLSLAATGNYPLSRAYFLAVLFVNPADSQARENLVFVESLFPPHMGEANNAGRIKAQAYQTEGGAVNDGVRRLATPLDLGGRVADATWLESLADDPGEFLRLRLSEEHLRRTALGLTPPEEGDPW